MGNFLFTPLPMRILHNTSSMTVYTQTCSAYLIELCAQLTKASIGDTVTVETPGWTGSAPSQAIFVTCVLLQQADSLSGRAWCGRISWFCPDSGAMVKYQS